jgi:hydrogenase maturation protease
MNPASDDQDVAVRDVLVIGCGNLLRGDDGVGPVFVRELHERGIPSGVRLADGGTAGMDVAFQMRGADRVILVDACRTGADPGTMFEVPGEELAELPPLEGINLHSFRWDHALAFARWLLKDEYPEHITVYLIEAEALEFGADLSPTVRAAMERLLDIVSARLGEHG